MNSIAGFRVIANSLAMTTAPRRKHRKTRSMSDSYHNRVQKKWLKRYGTVQEPGCIMVYDRLYVHPAIYDKVIKQLEKETGHARVRIG